MREMRPSVSSLIESNTAYSPFAIDLEEIDAVDVLGPQDVVQGSARARDANRLFPYFGPEQPDQALAPPGGLEAGGVRDGVEAGVLEQFERSRFVADGAADDGDVLNPVQGKTLFQAVDDLRRLNRDHMRRLRGGPQGEQTDVSPEVHDPIRRTKFKPRSAVDLVLKIP